MGMKKTQTEEEGTIDSLASNARVRRALAASLSSKICREEFELARPPEFRRGTRQRRAKKRKKKTNKERRWWGKNKGNLISKREERKIDSRVGRTTNSSRSKLVPAKRNAP
ncbi:hypothetical protein WH47_03766 [Habropoda laboriosa]|uniref:Uncharacterized protein n=1 Tax=Habropoda laboriosa TaxID=597456 RepID=A0A0L7QVZ1_9HYME|nr:hypothetical protein WH47_03766 [Habropoda laboriosa]